MPIRLFKLKWLVLLPLLFFTITGAFAQNIAVSGKVRSNTGEALPGVTIVLKNSALGTTTDMNGNYSLSVPDVNGILVFSYIGYTTQEVAINNRTSINVSLAMDAKTMEEVVVVGYGTVKKSDLTGSVASVKAEQLSAYPAQGTVQALKGRAAGV